VALTLTISVAGRNPQTVVLDLPRVSIGRGAHADVRLPSRTVSETHAVIHNSPSEMAIVDDGSSNGTRVNGATLPRGRRKILRDGDVVTIAQYTLRVSAQMARPDPPERTASLARRLLLDALSSSGGEAAPPRIVLITGKDAGSAWVIPPAPSRIVIGRDAECEIVLEDRDCSKQHAELLRDTESVVVRDLGSKNGIVLGGRAVNERRLRHGDEFTLGRTSLRYHDPTEEILRSMESEQDEPISEPVQEIGSTEVSVTEFVSPESSSAPVSTPPVVSEAISPTPAPPPSTPLSRGQFDWVVVVLAVVILVVSVSVLVLLLSDRH
jgi:pSer/pThr/pTyr-binding forkhead associated (FHA) protein